MSPHVDLQVVAGALHEKRHLVRHLADVGLGPGQHGQAGTLPGRRHEEKPRRHLDDGLTDVAAAEVPARPAGERLEPRGERGQMLGVGLRESPGGTERQAILGEEHRPGDVRNTHHQVIEEPVKLAHWVACGGAVMISLHRHCPPYPLASLTGLAASRAA
jgi:hypothetical protein